MEDIVALLAIDFPYAGVAYSDDNGENWITAGGPVWDNPGGDNKFQMAAFERRNGYLYLFATPNGRTGDAHLARVDEGDVLDKAAYDDWTATGRLGAVDSAPQRHEVAAFVARSWPDELAVSSRRPPHGDPIRRFRRQLA